MKRSTAIQHLAVMGGEATHFLGLRDIELGWPLEELWATGELLDADAAPDAGTVILMLDVAPGEVPWTAVHPGGEWVGDRLRMGKRPMQWYYRPMAWPAWNARHQQVVRFWSATAGLDEAVIEALRSGADLDVVEPSAGELREQLVVERACSHAHLRQVVDDYWDA